MNATKSSTPAITSLTSKSDNTNGSTSISEQLAISVANKICEQRTNSNNNSDDDELPTSPTEAITNTNGNKTVNCTRIQNRQIRVVSAEHHSTTTSPSTNETHKTDEQNSKSNNSNCMSSMSSAVADLASGMPNFGSNNTSNNSHNGNAPIIISGTAAAVLALQNPFNNNNNDSGNIVSSSNGYDESGSGGIVIQPGEGSNAVPNPLSILSDMATSTSNSVSSPTDHSNSQHRRQNSNGSNNNLSPSQRSTCYADGAPIISGTAAAQKFQHTATTTSSSLTATTSTTSTTNYNATNIIQNNLLSDDVILAVANINPYDTTSGGGGAVGQPYNNGTISMKSGTNSALFSVNHGTTTASGGSNNNNIKAQPNNDNEDIGSIIPDAANIKQSKDLGGMDILAELTCHALPMPTSSTSNNNGGIPSYQEIYQEQQQHQQGSGIREGIRQSSIPSYQEIYREMGLSPQSTSQHQQHSSYATEHHQPSNSQHQQHSRGTTYFGHIPNRDELEEGKEIYTRKEIAICGGHCAENKDVHGNMREGCDSLCLKDCMEKDIRESDGLLWFLYSTDRANGGGALCRSYHEKRPLRVFRSSLLNNKYAPPFLDVEDDIEDDSDVAYRYDGLYMVRAVWDIYGNETESHPVIGENGWQTFFCTRMPRRPLEKEKREEGVIYNTVGCQELWGAIQSMRGVRRPKKFEISMPPEKLPPIKRCAISGKFRDRKCVGYVKPVVEVPVEDVTKAKSKAPSRIKGQTNNKRGRQRRQQQEEEDSDLDEANESESEDSSEEDTASRKRAQSPKHKIMTPRPRLNSASSQLKRKTSSASAHDNDDSSDSETSTAAAATTATTQSKKRARSPSRKVILNNSLDVSAFFPKRASAARAEAANRNIVGSRSYKRKSSETTSSAAAASSKGKQGGGRKRAKANRRDEDEFSTSSEEDSNPNSIDHSILTVGSRILVAYKGSVFKSTIRKRREKSGKHDFLIHYDGNKKTNVHWITVDKITKILEINVDTPPKKTVGKKIGVKKRGNNGGGRRKAAATAKQDSMDSQESVSGKKAAPVRKDSMASQDSAVNKRVGLARSQSLQQSHYQDGSDDEEDDNKSHDSDDDSKKDEKSTNEESTAKSIPQAKKTATTKIVKAVEKKKSAPKSYPKASKEDEDEEEDSPSSESEPEEPPKRKRSNIKTTTVATATSRNSPRKAVVSDTKSPTKNRSIPPGLSSSSESDSDDESSTSSSDEDDNKKVAAAKPSEEYKYPVGGHVYVEYRRILYSSSILKAKRKRTVTEYLVHYEGYKKSSNRWVKEKDLHEVNTATTRRYEEQRHIPTDNEADQPSEASATTRRKNSEASEQISMDGSNRSVATKKKQPPPRRMRSDASEAALDALPSGVSFLAGSMVFVDWSGSLYLAKMMKKRYSGDRTEYLISYDGYKRSHDAWVSINKIYEVNPQSKRVFKMTEVTKSEKPKRPSSAPKPVVPKRRETRKKAQDDEEAASTSTRYSDAGLPFSRSSSQASSQSSSRQTSSIDMNGIEPGVDFLPGSQVFAEYKGGLCLAKMVKKRGKDDYMEYFVQYTGLKKSHETWLSVSMVWEINPQTKRMFRKLEVKK